MIHTGNPKPSDSIWPGEWLIQGVGSGVLIFADGKVLTAAHVIEGETRLRIEFANDERRELATLIDNQEVFLGR